MTMHVHDDHYLASLSLRAGDRVTPIKHYLVTARDIVPELFRVRSSRRQALNLQPGVAGRSFEYA